MNKFNIFISSPGDVQTERMIARRVIRKLQREFGDQVNLDAILWEDLPLQVTSSFQEGIDAIVSPDGIDVAVFILASRLGSAPGNKYKKKDGTYYRSGTEYEFDIMRAANEKSNGTKPVILAYVKNTNDSFIAQKDYSTDQLQELLEQKKAAEIFIKEKFYDSETHAIYGAYHQFDVPTSFEQKLTEHLRRIIIQKYGDIQRIEWYESPYLGLKSFDSSEESIFYGRQRVINDIMEQIVAESNLKAPSVFIIGPSGSGKSSLVKAGLLPDLMESESYHLQWDNRICYTPAAFNGKPYSGIINIIFDAFPELSEMALWKDLMNGKSPDAGYLSDSLNSIYSKSNPSSNLLICIDQFEEFFTDPAISEAEYNNTMRLINILIKTGKIWFFFTMRNDFYHHFSKNNNLLEIKSNSIVYDLPVMFPSEIQEIIEEPARKSGIRWEIENGVPLNKVVLNDALAYRDNLPLIEFALSRLYEKRNDKKEMTYLAYRNMGNMNGAIVHYADDVYNSFSQEEKNIFEEILSSLIKISSTQNDVLVRKTALKNNLIKTKDHEKVVNILIDAHLLVSGKNADGEATVTIVHEVLINQWNAIQQWIKKEIDLIKLNEYYETQSSHWIESNKNKNDLIHSKKSIRASEYFLYQWDNKISNNVRDYILESVKKKMRKGLRFLIALEFIVFIIVTYTFVALVFFPDYFASSLKIVDFDIDELFITDFLKGIPMAIQTIAILAYCIVKKIKAKPVYLTIKKSLVFWIVISGLSIVDLIVTFHGFVPEEYDLVIFGSYLILPLFVFVKTIQKWLQYRVITKDWKNRTVKQSKLSAISTRLAKFSNIIITVFIVFIGIFIMLLWGSTLSEKQTAFEESNLKLLQQYDGLDNISDRLSASDIYYINNERGNLLFEYYKDEINEDSEGYYALGMAKSLYNIGRPDIAILYYNGDDLWFRNYLYEAIGWNNFMDTCLRICWDNNKTTLNYNFPWQAEKCGNFELAKQSCEYYDSVYKINLDTIDVFTINYAHALLMTGEEGKALNIYQKYLNSTFPDGRLWKNEMINDFALFRWKGFDDTNIKYVENKLSLTPKKLYTTIADTANRELIERFAGKWQCVENGITINYEITIDNYNLAFYTFSDTKGNTWTSVTQYRLAEVDDSVVIEEYNSRTGNISAGYINMLAPKEMTIKIIENGDNNMRGYIRKYKRT